MHEQRGNILIIATLMLLVLGLMGLSAMQTSRTELRMASNEELRTGALQLAQSFSEIVLANSESLIIVAGNPGTTWCTGSDCDHGGLSIPDATLQGLINQGHLQGRIRYLGSGGQAEGSSASFGGELTWFEVAATLDRSSDGLGYARITQGLRGPLAFGGTSGATGPGGNVTYETGTPTGYTP